MSSKDFGSSRLEPLFHQTWVAGTRSEDLLQVATTGINAHELAQWFLRPQNVDLHVPRDFRKMARRLQFNHSLEHVTTPRVVRSVASENDGTAVYSEFCGGHGLAFFDVEGRARDGVCLSDGNVRRGAIMVSDPPVPAHPDGLVIESHAVPGVTLRPNWVVLDVPAHRGRSAELVLLVLGWDWKAPHLTTMFAQLALWFSQGLAKAPWLSSDLLILLTDSSLSDAEGVRRFLKEHLYFNSSVPAAGATSDATSTAMLYTKEWKSKGRPIKAALVATPRPPSSSDFTWVVDGTGFDGLLQDPDWIGVIANAVGRVRDKSEIASGRDAIVRRATNVDAGSRLHAPLLQEGIPAVGVAIAGHYVSAQQPHRWLNVLQVLDLALHAQSLAATAVNPDPQAWLAIERGIRIVTSAGYFALTLPLALFPLANSAAAAWQQQGPSATPSPFIRLLPGVLGAIALTVVWMYPCLVIQQLRERNHLQISAAGGTTELSTAILGSLAMSAIWVEMLRRRIRRLRVREWLQIVGIHATLSQLILALLNPPFAIFAGIWIALGVAVAEPSHAFTGDSADDTLSAKGPLRLAKSLFYRTKRVLLAVWLLLSFALIFSFTNSSPLPTLASLFAEATAVAVWVPPSATTMSDYFAYIHSVARNWQREAVTAGADSLTSFLLLICPSIVELSIFVT